MISHIQMQLLSHKTKSHTAKIPQQPIFLLLKSAIKIHSIQNKDNITHRNGENILKTGSQTKLDCIYKQMMCDCTVAVVTVFVGMWLLRCCYGVQELLPTSAILCKGKERIAVLISSLHQLFPHTKRLTLLSSSQRSVSGNEEVHADCLEGVLRVAFVLHKQILANFLGSFVAQIDHMPHLICCIEDSQILCG